MAEEKRRLAETAIGEPGAVGENEVPQELLPLRDREFTKSELAALEKKSWIEVKDLIFETEPSVLDYLSYHCTRWRVTQNNNLADIALAKSKGKTSGRRRELNTMNSTIRSVSQPPGANINLGATQKKGQAGARMNNASPTIKVREFQDGNVLMENSLQEGSVDPISGEDDARSQASSRKKTPVDNEAGSPSRKLMTASQLSEHRKRKNDPKVQMPEKGSCKS